ncbi:glucose/arabinose dehydrogenase [Pontibacter ummariensis]|uniref:Glucose/arabinose dehydrogenase, beta-propeller fold n=1 Tax=Pontibacter ummariensis TaxID=1610492 RepID=A0A239DY75_9BACT|nr:sorbosone dehydrogenase family protein [Pontibacter ummariensis]PRY13690.1 glucose/arabinose dehydrogenase [Pontibacter ummariensis]SNS37426.1 Glucose/arabinose dehydrogenase, beta-propeller fold [Pontibacter ummariensis]
MKKAARLFVGFSVLVAFSTGCSSENENAAEDIAKTGPTETTQAIDKGIEIGMPSGPVDPDLERIALPEGFRIDYYAKDVENARSMALSPSGILFVGTRSNDNVYAVVDEDRDGVADEVVEVASGLNTPNGVAYRNGDLYVAEVNRVLRFPNIEETFRNKPKFEVVNDQFPSDLHHGWKYIAFGPDDKLYVPVGAPCNICKSEDPIYATITRMNPDGTGLEVYAEGVRNSVGFDWHPETNNLYFTDNGRDMLGDNLPPDELNRATQKGQHFGYPYCHAGTIEDPEFGKLRDCSEFVQPARTLTPHGASLGMKFYTGNMFPSEYQNNIFVAEHGSWNRSEKIGYRVMQAVQGQNGEIVDYKPFATGWLEGQEEWGRPVDVVVMPDGSLLVSDDTNNAIYRITYSK